MKKGFLLFFTICISLPLSITLPAESQEAQHLSERDYHEYILYLTDLGEKKLMDFIIDEMQNFLSLFPEGHFAEDVQFKMGVLYEKLDKPLEACCAYLKALHLYPGSPRKTEIIEDLGRLCEKRGPQRNFKDILPELVRFPENEQTPEKRFEYYLLLLGRLNGMIENDSLVLWHIRECREFLRKYPESRACPGILMRLSSLYERQKMYQEAFFSLMRIRYLYPDAPVLPEALLKMGKVSLEYFDRPNRAIDFFTRVTVNYPKSTAAAEAMLLLARVYAEEKKAFDKAIASYDNLVADFPDSPLAVESLYEKALLLMEKVKNYPEALNVYLQLQSSYPEHPKAKVSLVNGAELAEEKMGDMKTAVRLYRMLASKYAEDPSASDWLCHAAILAEEQLVDVSLATALYGEVLDKYPDSRAASKAKKRLEKLTGSNK